MTAPPHRLARGSSLGCPFPIDFAFIKGDTALKPVLEILQVTPGQSRGRLPWMERHRIFLPLSPGGRAGAGVCSCVAQDTPRVHPALPWCPMYLPHMFCTAVCLAASASITPSSRHLFPALGRPLGGLSSCPFLWVGPRSLSSLYCPKCSVHGPSHPPVCDSGIQPRPLPPPEAGLRQVTAGPTGMQQ